MGAIRKYCGNCMIETVHNESGNKAGSPRCTKCAQPYGTGPKKERNEMAAKLAMKRKY